MVWVLAEQQSRVRLERVPHAGDLQELADILEVLGRVIAEVLEALVKQRLLVDVGEDVHGLKQHGEMVTGVILGMTVSWSMKSCAVRRL